MKKFIKNNIKLFIGIIIGGIIFGGAVAYADTIAASSVDYTKNSQSNVEGALDTLFTRASKWLNPNDMGTPQYYAFGEYKGWCTSTDTSCNSYADFPTTSTSVPSGRNVYAAKYADGGYGVCIKRSGTQHCFRGRNWIAEAKHVQEVFSDISCDVDSSNEVNCNADNLECSVTSDGYVGCTDDGYLEACRVYANGKVHCRG